MKVVFIEHVTKGTTGHIKRGEKCCVPCELSDDGVKMFVESEIDAMLDGHDDVMLLLTVGDMTEKEMDKATEFEGW